jgi:YHS domain-containing protein
MAGLNPKPNQLMKSLFTVFILTFASAGLAAAADKCPISGKPADSTITSKDKDGKTVAFCCEKCKAKFDAKK